ncbi:2,3-dihydro-2,3-dihydroxybenzoate dehydrogenase [Pendulispora brunnea]|uniref:2,3-dihydro-2,3-dihydroxybenzoate dehydrogenase n=1 Tax=Pendulispora brunnea TaxID=2905690 RepID=A0ABZ2KCY4_9BACT
MNSTRRRFEGKTIVVTGAAQGIGEAVARWLIAEGAFVYALDINEDRLARLSAGMNRERHVMEAMAVDIRARDGVEAAVHRMEMQRPIDGLVNVAGVLYPCSFEAMTPERWLETFNVNVHGTFFISHEVARKMIGRGGGVIVTVASNAASTPRVGMSAYCAAKAAIAMLTKCMGLELAKYGIRCNVVSPGSTNTPMLKAMGEHGEMRNRRLIEGDLNTYRTGIPLGRIAEAEDVASAVAFLLSEDARHITLHDLVVDGGATP